MCFSAKQNIGFSQFCRFYRLYRLYRDFTESEDSTDSIDSLDLIDSIDSILVPRKRPPTFTPHTKGKTTVPMGAARPVLLFARAARAPSCVV